jgi:hypothetical protein
VDYTSIERCGHPHLWTAAGTKEAEGKESLGTDKKGETALFRPHIRYAREEEPKTRAALSFAVRGPRQFHRILHRLAGLEDTYQTRDFKGAQNKGSDSRKEYLPFLFF